MTSLFRSPAVLIATGSIYAVIGIALGVGGAWLLVLGGSAYYAAAGLGIFATGALLIAGRPSALWVYAVVLMGTLIWAVGEIGFDWWPLAARGDIIYPLGLWLLTPWITRRLGASISSTFPLWAGVAAGAVVLGIGLSSTYNERDGAIVSADLPKESPGQPAEDWRDYGRSPFGQRYSPLSQITPDSVRNLKVAWTFRTGDQPGKNDPVETTFEVTPIKVRDTLYLCSQHQRLFALDAKTGTLRWSYDPKVQDNPTFQHLTCRGVSYHESAPGAVDTEGKPAGRLPTHDLPARQRRADDRAQRRQRQTV